MRRILLLLTLLASVTLVYSQTDYSQVPTAGRGGLATTFNTDYQAIGVNPGNLGLPSKYEVKHVAFGLAHFGGGVFLQGLGPNNFDKIFADAENLSTSERFSNASNFSNKTISLNIDAVPFGIAYQHDDIGGFAFNVRESFQMFFHFESNAADYMFKGALASQFDSLRLGDGSMAPNDPNQYQNYFNNNNGISKGIASTPITIGSIIKGTRIKSHWYREYNLNYGRKVFDDGGDMKVYAGLGLKLVNGYNYIDVSAESGKLEGFFALNPVFQFDSVTSTSTPSAVGNNKYQSIGRGVGGDIGVTVVYKDMFKGGISVVNIGSINYTGNVYKMKDTSFTEIDYQSTGFNAIGDVAVFEGIKNLKVKLPTMMRIGGSVLLGENSVGGNIAEIGFDAVIPFNSAAGNFDKPLWTIGGDVSPLRWFKVSSGFNIGGNTASKLNIPLGVTFVVGENGSWEVGFATRDFSALIAGNNTMYSFTTGLLRFRL